MFSWLRRKSENSRAYMLGKELNWKLEAFPTWRVAKIKIMAGLLAQSISEDQLMWDFLNSPYTVSRDEAMKVYGLLEDIRNNSYAQLKANQLSLSKFGVTIPQISVDHVEDTARGIEVWMATASMTVNAERAEDALRVWKRLIASRSGLNEAIRNLNEVQLVTSQLTGTNDIIFPNESSLQELYDFTPKVILDRILNSI